MTEGLRESRVLVTGGAGFIGSHTVDLLIRQGCRVTIVDDLSAGRTTNQSAASYAVDICSREMTAVFGAEKPDRVIHLAARIGVRESQADPMKDAATNVLGTINVLQNCVRFGVQKVVAASSVAVYMPSQVPVIDESQTLQPSSFYGLSKLTSEQYVKLFALRNRLNYMILRYSNVYGPRQELSPNAGVVSRFLVDSLSGHSPKIHGSGRQTRDFVFVGDVARANALALFAGNNQTVNVSSGKSTSVEDLLKAVQEALGEVVSFSYLPDEAEEPWNCAFGNSLAGSVLNWHPEFDLRRGLFATASHLKREVQNHGYRESPQGYLGKPYHPGR